MASIRRSDLSTSQLATQNSTLKICGCHFINGQPAKLFETTNPDWVPTLNLGHCDIKSPTEARYKRAKRRTEEKFTKGAETQNKRQKVFQEEIG